VSDGAEALQVAEAELAETHATKAKGKITNRIFWAGRLKKKTQILKREIFFLYFFLGVTTIRKTHFKRFLRIHCGFRNKFVRTRTVLGIFYTKNFKTAPHASPVLKTNPAQVGSFAEDVGNFLHLMQT
jgi:hypothetical protein